MNLKNALNLLKITLKKFGLIYQEESIPHAIYLFKIRFEKKKIYIEFSGFRWGIASNMIHFLDLFKWMTKANKITFRDKLNSKIYKAKRKGFYEVRGKIIFKDQNNNN